MSRLATRLAAAVVPVVLLAPAAAHAESLTGDDASSDARAINMGALLGEIVAGTPSDGPALLDAPAETSTDVVGTTIDHADKRLTLTVRFRDLVEVAGHSVDFRVRTSKGRYDLSVSNYDGETRVDLFPGDGDVIVVTSDGTSHPGPATKPCRTVRARYDLAADTLTASVPTSCLGAPKWVQVSAVAYRTQVTPQADGSANVAGYVDDAFRSGGGLRNTGRSPKVRRG